MSWVQHTSGLVLVHGEPAHRKGNLMAWQDHITLDPKVLAGKPVIRSTRIAVEFVVELLGRGWTSEQILREYDHLTPEDIEACLSHADNTHKPDRAD